MTRQTKICHGSGHHQFVEPLLVRICLINATIYLTDYLAVLPRICYGEVNVIYVPLHSMCDLKYPTFKLMFIEFAIVASLV